jgi:hypothetical protein
VSDVVTLARMARESLSQGLKALQGDPNVPRHLLELAQPVAQAMGLLHQIERSGGAQLGPNAQAALANLQTALAQLQAQPPQHPAVAAALEAVAGALASVHTLVRMAAAPAATAPTAMAPAAPRPQTAARPKPTAQAPVQPAQPQTQARAPQGPPPMPAQPLAGQGGQPGQGGQGARPAGRAEAAQPAAAGAPVTAELGAHSASNFYKGLSGNDIIDHGGLFVSTYKLPKIGQPIRLKVALPGGYEFEAGAIVRWRREPSDEGNDAPPGFGAQFTDIAIEARQLVYRYVRNREPLFHDDL